MKAVRAFVVASLVVASAAPILAVAAPAFAQRVEVSAAVDQNQIELGDIVTLTLHSSSDTGDAPTDPQLGGHAGFSVVNQASGPSHSITIIGGRRSDKHGLTASWTLRADRLGTFTLGPPSVAIGGARKQAAGQRVTVVAPGTLPTPRPGGRKKPQTFDPFSGTNPFDPWKGLLPSLDDDDDDPRNVPPQVRGALDADRTLSLDAPRAPIAFLHATIDKTRAVVGEQVTLNVYLYEDPRARQAQPSDVHEATATDFVKKSLLQDETRAVHLGTAMVGGRPWAVKLVRKNALFPIKTGKLVIAPMSLTLSQARVGLRESESLTVDVTEPPVNGRPAGFQMGDVGDFSLSAQVAPPILEQHGAVGVTVELRGTGNMPGQLQTPAQPGIEWLEPQVKDATSAGQNDRYGGTRTFTYVVRVHKEGTVDLGEIRLPYFDPQTRAYNVAHASLGIVQVSRAAGRDAGAPDPAEVVLTGLPIAKPGLEGTTSPSFVTDGRAFWSAIFGAPLASALVVVAAGAAKKARERRLARTPSPAKIAKDRRAEAEAALAGADGKAALSAVTRAIEAGALATTGVNVRGTSAAGAARELEDAGVSSEAAKELLDLLRAGEDARFSPDGVSIETARDLWKRARGALEKLDAEGLTGKRSSATDRGATS